MQIDPTPVLTPVAHAASTWAVAWPDSSALARPSILPPGLLGSLNPTLAAGAAGGLAIDLLLILACAGGVALLLRALRVSPIPGYLIAGAIIGPSALGFVSDSVRIDEIANLAVVMLMFGIGLHLDLASVRKGAWAMITVGVVSTVLSSASLALLAMGLGLGPPAAIAVGMALAMSSTAVALRVIQERRDLHRAYGRLSFGVLIVQDLLVIGAIALLPVLADWSAQIGGAVAESGRAPGESWTDVLLGGAWRLGAVAMLIFGGRAVLPPLLMAMTRAVSPEVVLVISSAVALGAAVLCGALGFSPELGAFIAGFLLSATPLRFQLGGQLAPLRDLFMAVLFTAVGLKLNVAVAAELWYVVVLGTAAVIGFKAIAIGGSAWVAGVPASTAAQTGLSLAQAGEFSLVLLAAAAASGLVTGDRESVTIAVVMASLMLAPLGMHAGRLAFAGLITWPLAPWVRRPSFTESPATVLTGNEATDGATGEPVVQQPRVVIAGYGPVGRACADKLAEVNIPFTIVELNTQTVRRQLTLGRSIVYGDVTNPEVLHSAGVPDADAVLITIPDEEAMLRACRECRRIAPRAFIAVRAAVLSRGMIAKELGADQIFVAEIATAEAMSSAVTREVLRVRDIDAVNIAATKDPGTAGQPAADRNPPVT